MPKLDLKSAYDYWNSYDDPMIFRVVAFMEAMEEGWTKDGDPALEQTINKLGDILEDLSGFEVGEEANFIKLATYLKMPRLLRMLASHRYHRARLCIKSLNVCRRKQC